MTKGLVMTSDMIDEEVQRSLELLDQVLSEFDEADIDDIEDNEEESKAIPANKVPESPSSGSLSSRHSQKEYGNRNKDPPWTSSPIVEGRLSPKEEAVVNGSCSSPDSAAASDAAGPSTNPLKQPAIPEDEPQSEDDGYISMNGRSSLPRSQYILGSSALPSLSPAPLESAETNEQQVVIQPPPPSPAEAERIIAALLPRVSPRHPDRRKSDEEVPRQKLDDKSPSSRQRKFHSEERPNTPTTSHSTQTLQSLPQSWWIPCESAQRRRSNTTPRQRSSALPPRHHSAALPPIPPNGVLNKHPPHACSPKCACAPPPHRLDRKFFLPLNSLNSHTGWPNFIPDIIPPKTTYVRATSMPSTSKTPKNCVYRRQHSFCAPGREYFEVPTRNFQPVMRDRLGRNVNIYLPGPPSPTPDYSPYNTDGEGSHKKISEKSKRCVERKLSDASVSEDSLQGTPRSHRHRIQLDKKCKKEATLIECSDNESFFSDDSLESEPSSLHCTWGSRDRRLEEESETIEEEGSNIDLLATLSQSPPSLCSTPSFLPSGDETRARWSWQSSLEGEATAQQDITQGDILAVCETEPLLRSLEYEIQLTATANEDMSERISSSDDSKEEDKDTFSLECLDVDSLWVNGVEALLEITAETVEEFIVRRPKVISVSTIDTRISDCIDECKDGSSLGQEENCLTEEKVSNDSVMKETTPIITDVKDEDHKKTIEEIKEVDDRNSISSSNRQSVSRETIPINSELIDKSQRKSSDFSSICQLLQDGLLEGLDEEPPAFKPPPPPPVRRPKSKTDSRRTSLRSSKSSSTRSSTDISSILLEDVREQSPSRSSPRSESSRRSLGLGSTLIFPEAPTPRRESAFPTSAPTRTKPVLTPAYTRPGIRMGVRAAMEGSPVSRLMYYHQPITPNHHHHRYSTEALDKLGSRSTSMDSRGEDDFFHKPATLPPGLSPNFHHRSSARETLRRVTSLLIRRGSSKEKANSNNSTKTANVEAGPDGLPSSNPRPKRNFFKSLWRRSRQYSLEQH